MKNYSSLFFVVLLFLSACTDKDERKDIVWKNIEKSLQEKLINAQDGEVITLEAGYFWFTRGISIEGKNNIVIKGAGMDQTFLSFAGQEEGAEGVKVSNCTNFTIEEMTIEDAKGDNLKISNTDGVVIRKVRSTWTGGPKETNGAYALYPVLCKNVLIENSIAIGASDAGIYVGQSDSVIIRNNEAFHNVAGIESENSNHVLIHDNHAHHNTGGILVFDLPGLNQYGRDIKVYNNRVEENNHENFAPEGNIVGVVPPGTGMLLLATREVDLYDNQIINNKTIGIGVLSYELVIAMSEGQGEGSEEELSAQGINSNYQLDLAYDPYPADIRIHKNTFSNKYWFPTFKSDFGRLLLIKFPFSTPAVLWDGFIPDGKKDINLCFKDNEGFTYVNLDAPNDLKNMSEDFSKMICNE